MKIASIIGIICALLIGIAIGYELAQNKKSPQEIALHFNTAGDLIATAKKGDTVKWTDQRGKPTGVIFDLPSPCDPSSDQTKGTCKLTASGTYKYKCDLSGCEDPAVGGGDDMVALKDLDPLVHLNPPYASPRTVYLSCPASGPSASAITGPTGSGFFVQFNDDASSVTFPPKTCGSGDTLNSKNSTCRIAATVPGTYPYIVNLTGCTGTGSSTLTVSQPVPQAR